MTIPVGTASTFARSGGFPGITGQEFPNYVSAMNAQSGVATLVAGTVTITGVTLTANSVIMLSYATTAGTLGSLSAPTASRNTSTGQFVLSSSSGTDTSTVNWLIIG